jgi:hypothetical protein
MCTARNLGGVLRALVMGISVSILFVPASRAYAVDDIGGEWELQMDRDGRVSFATLSLAKKPDGAWSGKWGAAEISEVKFDGGKLTFTRMLRFGDQEVALHYEGTLKDGSFAGTLSSERGSFTANAARPRPRNPVLGRWDLKYKIGEREIEGTLAVSEGPGGALDAKWTTSTGEHVVSNVKFEGGKLSLARKSKIGEREFESAFEGKVEGHKLVGKIQSPMGEIPLEGSRVGAELVGRWELTSTSDRGPRTSTLTVFGDLSGRYEVFGSEIPFKDLKLDGGTVAFSVETGFREQTFKIDFTGKVDGKTLKGEITTPRGTREVSGKKLDAVSAPRL